jgi:hypothetical protein
VLARLLAFVLLSAQTAAAVQPIESFHITVQVIRLRSVAEMLRACNEGTDGIHGCAHIVGEVLTTNCSEERGRWSLVARGHARALIYVADPDVVLHELKHVSDISEAANGLIAGASAETYTSKEACEAAATSLTGHFRAELQEVARASNAKRR